MCGIIGIISQTPVADRLLSALRRLEYRGYDSAGIAVWQDQTLAQYRAVGALDNLQKKVPLLSGTIGIGHTRWATHGEPKELNAHPHISQKRVAVVHNGIIENFSELKRQLLAEKFEFDSETDTEVVAHLISRALQQTGGDLHQTMIQVLGQLSGAFALVVLIKDYPDRLIVARQGSSPLAIGYGQGEMAISSDALGLVTLADKLAYLDDKNWGIVYQDRAEIFDFQGHPLKKDIIDNPMLALNYERGQFEHYMLKEIHEQPGLLRDLYQNRHTFSLQKVAPIQHVTFLGCGTAYYASWIGKYYWEQLTRCPATLELASEFHYRCPPMIPGVTVVVSQSGETADTLKAAEYAKSQGQTLVAVVNVPQSSLARLADVVFYTQAGPEIGVASTKAFTTQAWVLLMLALSQASQDTSTLMDHMAALSPLMEKSFLLLAQVQEIARSLATEQSILYLGRGLSYPLALEGALKMKEISYIHAEGLASGELKHGPIALIDERVSVIVLAPFDSVFEKTLSNMHEISARRGKIIAITDELGAPQMGAVSVKDTLVVPAVDPLLTPFISTVILQLLAYYTAFYKGDAIDKPRHLAKCVTVE